MRQLHPINHRSSFLFTSAINISRLYSSHIKLIETMKSLGYPHSDGVCHGVACLAARYHLSDDIKTFHHHIKFTQKYARFIDTQSHETRRFFDDILIGQSPFEYPLIKNIAPIFKNNKTQDAITALAAIKNTGVKKQCNIKRIAHFTGAYSLLELCRYFDLLGESASLHACTFALLLGSPAHSIMVGFDAEKCKWTLIDANQLPQRNFAYYNSARLAIETNRALSSSRSGNTIFSTQLLTTGHCKSKARDFITDLQGDERWQKLHAVFKRKATLSDSYNNTWLMEACAIDSEIGIATALIEQGANFSQTNTEGNSALTFAISFGNNKATELLLKNGYNPNHPANLYLRLAANNGFYDITKNLLTYGAKIHPGYESPIFTAASKSDHRLIKLYKQYGYSGAGSSLDRFFSFKPIEMKRMNSDNTQTFSQKP